MENVQKTRRLFASAYGCKASRSFLIWGLSAAMSISVIPMMAEISVVDKAVSRNAVLDCIWEATGNDVYDHTVTVYMKRIRAKLGEDVIKTVKGIGYRVDSDETL